MKMLLAVMCTNVDVAQMPTKTWPGVVSQEYGDFEITKSLGTLSQEYDKFEIEKSLGGAVERCGRGWGDAAAGIYINKEQRLYSGDRFPLLRLLRCAHSHPPSFFI